MFIEFVIILLLLYVSVFLAMRHVRSLLPDHGWNLNSLNWREKSQPLDDQGSPSLAKVLLIGIWFLDFNFTSFWSIVD